MRILNSILGWFGSKPTPKRHVCTANKCAVCEQGLIENGRYKGHEICSECLIDQIRAVKERGAK